MAANTSACRDIFLFAKTPRRLPLVAKMSSVFKIIPCLFEVKRRYSLMRTRLGSSPKTVKIRVARSLLKTKQLFSKKKTFFGKSQSRTHNNGSMLREAFPGCSDLESSKKDPITNK